MRTRGSARDPSTTSVPGRAPTGGCRLWKMRSIERSIRCGARIASSAVEWNFVDPVEASSHQEALGHVAAAKLDGEALAVEVALEDEVLGIGTRVRHDVRFHLVGRPGTGRVSVQLERAGVAVALG